MDRRKKENVEERERNSRNEYDMFQLLDQILAIDARFNRKKCSKNN